MPQRLGIRYVGGPTALLQVGGLQLLTDPTFDPPGEHPVGDRVLVKTADPAIPPDGLGAVDAVLLSHDQHPDNLDTLGRAWAGRERAPGRGGHRVRPGRRGPAHGVRQRRQRLARGGAGRRLPDPDQPGRGRGGQAPRARAVVPLHFEGWAHFIQGRDSLSAAFDDAGLADRLHLPEPGSRKELTA